MNNRILLWLDDCRDPFDKDIDWMVFSPIGRDANVIWVKTYNEFINYILENGLPNGICFDHDLGTQESGYDCVKWLVNYCLDNNLELPKYAFQSANPVGRENMKSLLDNYQNFITNNYE